MFHEIENHITRSKMPNREMVKEMTKEEVVELMTNTIVALNAEVAHQQNISQEEIDKAIETTRPQFDSINSILYEVLKANKVIN
jgi:transcriptional/translational regulatory protein YebC/TACO1